MVEFRRNQFLNQGLQTEFTIQSENKNKLVSASSQLKNLNNIEKNKYIKLDSSFEESSGESSVMCEFNRQRKLNVDEVISMVVDTDCEQAVKLEAKPFQKHNRVDSEWENQKTIIVIGIDEEALDTIILEEFFDEQFKDKPFIQFKRVQLGSYAGKLSVILRMKEDKGAQYVYYNLTTSSHKYKKALGENIEIAQLKNLGKKNHVNEIIVSLRFLPLYFNKEQLDQLQNIRTEELFQYSGYKYGVFRAQDYETAESSKKKLLKYFQNKKYNDIHIKVLTKRRANKDKFKQFYEEDALHPRVQLEQKMGIMLSPIKMPQLVVREIEQPKLKPLIIQPTICPIQIEPITKQFDLKPAFIEAQEQKVIARPVQLKPVTISVERQRSSRKK